MEEAIRKVIRKAGEGVNVEREDVDQDIGQDVLRFNQTEIGFCEHCCREGKALCISNNESDFDKTNTYEAVDSSISP